jgi:hypothetical protein
LEKFNRKVRKITYKYIMFCKSLTDKGLQGVFFCEKSRYLRRQQHGTTDFTDYADYKLLYKVLVNKMLEKSVLKNEHKEQEVEGL